LFGVRGNEWVGVSSCFVVWMSTWGSLLSPSRPFSIEPRPPLPPSAFAPPQTHHNRPGSVTRGACVRDVCGCECIGWGEGACCGGDINRREEPTCARWLRCVMIAKGVATPRRDAAAPVPLPLWHG
jgi:hypothetical protein